MDVVFLCYVHHDRVLHDNRVIVLGVVRRPRWCTERRVSLKSNTCREDYYIVQSYNVIQSCMEKAPITITMYYSTIIIESHQRDL